MRLDQCLKCGHDIIYHTELGCRCCPYQTCGALDYEKRLVEAPLYTRPLVGFRRFLILGLGTPSLRLESVFIHYEWSPGENVARCEIEMAKKIWRDTSPYTAMPWDVLPDRHEAPHPSCGCGLYALHRPPSRSSHERYVEGAIIGYGRMEVHRDGWRAEKAKIIALNEWTMAKHYGVPYAGTKDQLFRIAAEHGELAEEAYHLG